MPRVVLITGCSAGGIGYSLCERFAAEDCHVYATARRLEAMEGLSTHPLIKLNTLDVTNDADVRRVVDLVIAEAGHIDILVNNAGVMGVGPLIEQPIENVKAVFDTNFNGALRVTQAVFPHMATRRSGLVVNIGSVVGEVALPWNGLYSATKFAMHAMSNVLNMEFRPFNIRVMNVAPAATRSNIAANEGAKFSLSPTSRYSAYLPDILRRLNSSQSPNAMPSDECARQVVRAALKRNPPIQILLGGNAWVFKIMRWMPHSFVFWFFWRLYSKKR